ncbi:MAG: glycosyltransferase [Pyrinomonadaceae bacterium]
MEKTNNRIKVLAIVPYHLDFCAGQRFRIELWARELAKRGIDVKYAAFTDRDLTNVLYQPGKITRKVLLMLRAFTKQLKNILTAEKPDVVFIYREAALFGPAIIEKIARRWKIPVIYDIDEPLFIPFVSQIYRRFSKLIFFSKFDDLLQNSNAIFAVNQAIADYAAKFNDDVNIVPMTVDVERYKPSNKNANNNKPILGWVGT